MTTETIPAAPTKSCCHTVHQSSVPTTSCQHSAKSATPSPHAHAHSGSGWRQAASITLHCLTGCAIGEWLGLSIGLLLDLPIGARIGLAVALAYVSGFVLTLIPLLRGGMRFGRAFQIVWVGEAVSIAAMEIAMNVVDYHLGGMRRGMTLLHPQYWIAFGVAAMSGYVAAWPVNRWMLARGVKKACH